MTTFEQEVKKGQRFEFGRNWKSFLSTLTDERINVAEDSIREMLQVNDLKGMKFLDIGSGSGLFSLAARRLGAVVHSFDYDPVSVACTQELRSRYFSDSQDWIIEQGSVLDTDYLNSLGSFDVVYSWGVLHHTGNMWQALENVAALVKKKGMLYIAIYNDLKIRSKLWRKIKKLYCSGIAGRIIVCSVYIPYFFLKACARCLVKRENVFSNYKKKRGMSIFHDWFDWLGGFPYEVAKVEDVFHCYTTKGFMLKNIKTTNSLGINQFVFVKD